MNTHPDRRPLALLAGLLAALSGILLIAGQARAAEPAREPEDLVIELGDVTLTAWAWGDRDRDLVIALPGSGADNTRYRDLGSLVADAGYFFVAVNQRGIKGSTGNLDNLTLHDFAGDIVKTMDHFDKSRAHLVGWAMGNRIQRMVATDYPERVASVTLLAAGGLVPSTAAPSALNRLLAESDIPVAEKIALARETLFAAATDDQRVRQFVEQLTYWPEGRDAQRDANRSVPREVWWAGGASPMLIVQGLEDSTAPVGNGRQMKETYGDRITLVEIPDAGHLMGFEKPQETAAAIIEFLARHPI